LNEIDPLQPLKKTLVQKIFFGIFLRYTTFYLFFALAYGYVHP